MMRATTTFPSRRQLPLAIQICTIALFLLLWELSVRRAWVDSLFLASPTDTFANLATTTVLALPHLYATVTTFAVAFVLGVGWAVILGFALNASGYARATFLPLLVLGVTIPKVTLLPLFVLWFGIDKTTVIVYAALSAFFPMIVNVAAAGTEVKPNQVLLAKAMGYGHLQIYRKVIFPAMLPVLASGLFYACNAAMMGVFIVELALSRFGMGAFIHDLAVTFRTAELYAAVLLTATITAVINMALWYLARYLGRWRT
jgi:ABC-type nitrate/sulfonate/bicarbonate transport system permease component